MGKFPHDRKKLVLKGNRRHPISFLELSPIMRACNEVDKDFSTETFNFYVEKGFENLIKMTPTLLCYWMDTLLGVHSEQFLAICPSVNKEADVTKLAFVVNYLVKLVNRIPPSKTRLSRIPSLSQKRPVTEDDTVSMVSSASSKRSKTDDDVSAETYHLVAQIIQAQKRKADGLEPDTSSAKVMKTVHDMLKEDREEKAEKKKKYMTQKTFKVRVTVLFLSAL